MEKEVQPDLFDAKHKNEVADHAAIKALVRDVATDKKKSIEKEKQH